MSFNDFGSLQSITNPNNTTLSQQWSNKKVSSLIIDCRKLIYG
jgi:hypothetical protein